MSARIEVAPRSIPLSNTGSVTLVLNSLDEKILLPVGGAVLIQPGTYKVVALVKDATHEVEVAIATIDYSAADFNVRPTQVVIKGAQFGVYVNLLDLGGINPTA